MNVIKILIILLALPVGGVPNVTAHAQSSPFSAIGKSVAERMPGWKLQRWRWLERDNLVVDNLDFYDWTLGEEKVRAELELLPSPEEAAELFKTRPHGRGSTKSGVFVLEEGFTGIGDESYLIKYEGRRRMVFRKGRIIVHVTASSQELAGLFGVCIAEAIPAA